MREAPEAVGAAANAAPAGAPAAPSHPAMPPRRPRAGDTGPPPSPAEQAARGEHGGGGSSGPTKPDPLRPGGSGGDSGGGGEGGGGSMELTGLYRVAVTLPPPAIGAAGAEELPAPTRKALTKLLAACGLATSGRDSAAEGGAEAAAACGALSLSAFLPEAVEELRLGLDRLGHLCLSAAESDEAWAAFLSGADIGFVLQQRRAVEGIRRLEAAVAKAGGLGQVYTPYGNLTEPPYRAFLERLAAAAAERGPLGGGAFRELSLCVLQPVPPVQGQPAEPACRVDASAAGVVQPAHGGAVVSEAEVAALRQERRQAEQLAELADRTRQRLRLRSLTRDPRVAPDRFRRACGLLLDQAVALAQLLEGCSVRVGLENRLAPDGSCTIEIAHDCEL
ncbi:hypothetical protein TSOC_012164 [Tetrabaena socialis]|uniref:DUF4461 domain-containing protein n=1 Tax=Tetrabaena socialis TaxID=47790 RepID=A0A2J7ZNQ5_9CHLO|nr:hypothetical protein TSOC_012164 [Tetrabaena socialis]|eukprot:PNH01906.1 hypothetical protein TSOC_012164 [Tetrabaena socialis]